MTPKEKAEELIKKYDFVYIQNYSSKHEVKEAALICVNEILDEFPQGFKGNFEERRKQFWGSVKIEIENI